ncbi:MAG: hypothetical protein QFF03_11785 [Pseudomonadota bacterium]|nr:hypothetical protein [Pseudomonadota bacterium]
MRWLMCCLTMLAVPAWAEPVHGFRFHIVTGDDSAQTRRIADDLSKRLVPLSALFRTELAQRRRMIYFAIGPVALRDVAARKDDCMIIAAFTSSQVWRAIAAATTPARAAAMTAVYAEPAPADQLRLVALLYRRPVRIAAIVGAGGAYFKPMLNGAAVVEELAPGDDINRVINRIAPSEVLLAMPDSTVYNAENIRNILLSTYRHKQGVIGFSADMVKAGALATTYSEIEDINAQVAEMAATFVATGTLAPPQFPRYFSTIVNEGVARSLDIDVGAAARKFAHHPPARPR